MKTDAQVAKQGSSLFLGLRQSVERLVGRIPYSEMFPLNTREVGDDMNVGLNWIFATACSFIAAGCANKIIYFSAF